MSTLAKLWENSKNTLGVKLIHPSGGKHGWQAIMIFLLILITFFILPTTSFAVDSDSCKNLLITDDKGNTSDSLDPNTQKIIWSVQVLNTDKSKKYTVYTDDGRIFYGPMGSLSSDYVTTATNTDGSGRLSGTIDRNGLLGPQRPFTPEKHSLSIEIDVGGGIRDIYCQFKSVYTIISPPIEQSARCNLEVSSLPDTDGKLFTPSAEILVKGTVFPKGFSNYSTMLSFPGSVTPGQSMQLIGPGGKIIYITGGNGLRKVNYPNGTDPNTNGDTPISFESNLGILSVPGTYTITVPTSSNPTYDFVHIEQLVIPQDSISVWAKPNWKNDYPQDAYGRFIWAPMSCQAQFKIDINGGFFITPTPIPPAPTIPAVCFDAAGRAAREASRCSSPFENCPWCPKTKTKRLGIDIPNLKPLCDQLPTEFRGKCWQCQDKGEIWSAIGCLPTDFSALINKYVFTTGVGIAGGIAFLYFLYGAFLILTSSGNAEKMEEAKQIITSALAGLLLIIFSIFLLQVIGVQILQLPDFK